MLKYGGTLRNKIFGGILEMYRVIAHRPRVSKLLPHPILRELKWPSIDDLVAERDIGMIHWLLANELAPVGLRERVTYRESVSLRETRVTEAGQLQLPRVRTEQSRQFFMYRAAALWNITPSSVRTTRFSSTCRKRARTWLAEQRET